MYAPAFAVVAPLTASAFAAGSHAAFRPAGSVPESFVNVSFVVPSGTPTTA